MSPLRQALADYLAVRRALGYKLERTEKLLAQFLTYLEDRDQERLSTETALAWATLPTEAHQSWWSSRLSIVRGFAAHLRTLEPATEVPPADLLPWRRCRATPYVYWEQDVTALITAAAKLRTPHRVATYRTLIALLAATGMRVGEAIALDRRDFESKDNVLIVRNSKFGKSRELPLHSSTGNALGAYLRRRDRPRSAAGAPALLLSTAGTRLLYCNVQHTFGQLVRRAGLTGHSAACRPRLHDLRHSFAVHTVLDAYRKSADPGARIALLSSYLGHVDPGKTYWYLSATPELLALAGDCRERHLGGGS